MFSIDLSGWGDALAAVVDFIREHWATVATGLLVLILTAGWYRGCVVPRVEKKLASVTEQRDQFRLTVNCGEKDNQKECVKKASDIVVEHSAYRAALSTCRANTAALEVGVARCNEKVDQLLTNANSARAKAERRIAAERAKRADAESFAAELHSRLETEDQCTEQVRIALEAVMP